MVQSVVDIRSMTLVPDVPGTSGQRSRLCGSSSKQSESTEKGHHHDVEQLLPIGEVEIVSKALEDEIGGNTDGSGIMICHLFVEISSDIGSGR